MMSNIINRVLISLLRISSSKSLVQTTAYILYLYIKYNNAKNVKKPNVLCLSRARFENDIIALKQYESRFHFIDFPFNLLKVAQLWLPKDYEQTYYQAKIYKNGIEVRKSNALVTSLLEHLRRGGYKVEIILSANFDYYQDFAFKTNSSVKYVALSREHYLINRSFQVGLKRYRGNYKFLGNKILVFGNKTKKMLLESGVCEESKIVVTGSPRMDLLVNSKVVPVIGKYITLISFIDGNYGGDNCFKQILHLLKVLALEYPQQQFYIKCKSSQDFNIISPQISLIKNIIADYKTGFAQVFNKSKLIISFNSNSLLEALLSNSKIVVPYWDETKKGCDELIICPEDEIKEEYTFANNVDSLRDCIVESIKEDSSTSIVNTASRKKLLNKYFFLPDKMISNYVGDQLVDLLEKSGANKELGSSSIYSKR